MMRSLRWLVVLGLVLYAGWLAGPLIEHVTGAVRLSRMPHFPPPAGIRPVSGDPMNLALWVGMILAFLATAVLLAGHSRRALVAYVLGAGTNAVLALTGGHELLAGSMHAVLFLLGALVLGGVLVLNACTARNFRF